MLHSSVRHCSEGEEQMKNRTEELEDLKELRLAAEEALQLLRDVQAGISAAHLEEEMAMSVRRLQAILNVYAD